MTDTWSWRFRPTPASAALVEIPSFASSSGQPTPDSISSCGVLTTPADTSTSRPAFATRILPPTQYSTPTARTPSKTIRVASALTMTLRFGRRRAGCK